MSPVREVGLTALREIRRNLGSTKGIALSILFFLGGLVPNLLITTFQALGAGETLPPDERRKMIEEGLGRLGYAADLAHHLATWPPVLALMFSGSLIAAPLLILLIGFDQISGDIQHRAIRYIAGRSRRESIVIGKAVGLWGVIAVLMLITNVTVWIFTLIQGSGAALEVLKWGPLVWLSSVTMAAAWVGLISLVSSFFKTPVVALFVAAPVFFTMWLTHFILRAVNPAQPARWAFPFRYEDLIMSEAPKELIGSRLSMNVAHVLGGMGASIAWGAVMVAIATLVVKRRDI